MNYYHTASLMFKNGGWIKYPGMYKYPFEYSDAGIIHTINGVKIYDHITWYRKDTDVIYVRDGLPYIYEKTLKGLICRIKWALGLKRQCGYFHEVGIYKQDDAIVYIYRDFISCINVSFYKDSRSTYILFGEGDCCRSVLTDLAVGDHEYETEQAVAKEIYNWCYENALTWISDLICGSPNQGWEFLQQLRADFENEE